jgi:hypothetical protein
MWSAATRWLKEHSTFKLDRSESVLETRCGRYSESFACYTLTRHPRREGDTLIHIYVACGNDFVGCAQPATQLRNELTDFMVSARSKATISYTQ